MQREICLSIAVIRSVDDAKPNHSGYDECKEAMVGISLSGWQSYNELRQDSSPSPHELNFGRYRNFSSTQDDTNRMWITRGQWRFLVESFSLYELLSAVDSFQLTVSWIIGHVLTHSGDSFHICSLFPVKFLTLICQEALTPDCIDRFFRVCSCSYDSVQFSIMENDQVVSHTHHDIEVFGSRAVFTDCINQLESIITADDSVNVRHNADNAEKDLPITVREIFHNESIHETRKLRRILLKYFRFYHMYSYVGINGVKETPNRMDIDQTGLHLSSSHRHHRPPGDYEPDYPPDYSQPRRSRSYHDIESDNYHDSIEIDRDHRMSLDRGDGYRLSREEFIRPKAWKEDRPRQRHDRNDFRWQMGRIERQLQGDEDDEVEDYRGPSHSRRLSDDYSDSMRTIEYKIASQKKNAGTQTPDRSIEYADEEEEEERDLIKTSNRRRSMALYEEKSREEAPRRTAETYSNKKIPNYIKSSRQAVLRDSKTDEDAWDEIIDEEPSEDTNTAIKPYEELQDIVKSARQRASQRARDYKRQSTGSTPINTKSSTDNISITPIQSNRSRIESIDSLQPSHRSKSNASASSQALATPTSHSKARMISSPPNGSVSRSKSENIHDLPPSRSLTPSSEEARRRAAQRIKEARKQDALKKMKEDEERDEKQRQKWIERDQKIALFLERQAKARAMEEEKTLRQSYESLTGSSAIPRERAIDHHGDKISPVGYKNFSPSQLAAVGLTEHYANRDIAASNGGNDRDYPTRSKSVKSVLSEAEEVENLISSALGTATSSSSSSKRLFQSPGDPSIESTPSGTIDVVSITVVRAWDLPEALGPTNPYIIIDWERFGRSSTHSISSTTSPRYGSYLRFRSPFIPYIESSTPTSNKKKSRSLSTDAIVIHGQKYTLADIPMSVMAYSRNQSVSDEILGQAVVKRDDIMRSFRQNKQMSNAGTHDDIFAPLIIQLHSAEYEAAGFVEIIISCEG